MNSKSASCDKLAKEKPSNDEELILLEAHEAKLANERLVGSIAKAQQNLEDALQARGEYYRQQELLSQTAEHVQTVEEKITLLNHYSEVLKSNEGKRNKAYAVLKQKLNQ